MLTTLADRGQAPRASRSLLESETNKQQVLDPHLDSSDDNGGEAKQQEG